MKKPNILRILECVDRANYHLSLDTPMLRVMTHEEWLDLLAAAVVYCRLCEETKDGNTRGNF